MKRRTGAKYTWDIGMKIPVYEYNLQAYPKQYKKKRANRKFKIQRKEIKKSFT